MVIFFEIADFLTTFKAFSHFSFTSTLQFCNNSFLKKHIQMHLIEHIYLLYIENRGKGKGGNVEAIEKKVHSLFFPLYKILYGMVYLYSFFTN